MVDVNIAHDYDINNEITRNPDLLVQSLNHFIDFYNSFSLEYSHFDCGVELLIRYLNPNFSEASEIVNKFIEFINIPKTLEEVNLFQEDELQLMRRTMSDIEDLLLNLDVPNINWELLDIFVEKIREKYVKSDPEYDISSSQIKILSPYNIEKRQEALKKLFLEKLKDYDLNRSFGIDPKVLIELAEGLAMHFFSNRAEANSLELIMRSAIGQFTFSNEDTEAQLARDAMYKIRKGILFQRRFNHSNPNLDLLENIYENIRRTFFNSYKF